MVFQLSNQAFKSFTIQATNLFLALNSEYNYSGFLLAGSLIKPMTAQISDRVVKCCTILGAAGATDALRLLDLVDCTGIFFISRNSHRCDRHLEILLIFRKIVGQMDLSSILYSMMSQILSFLAWINRKTKTFSKFQTVNFRFYNNERCLWHF